MDFELLGPIREIQPIAVGRAIRGLVRLRKRYGSGRWRKLKGIARVRLIDGTIQVSFAGLAMKKRGIHSEMKTVVNEYHKANLAVLNLGPNPGIFFSGAHAMNELVRPTSVILTHPNEPVTENGKLRPASRTAALIKQLKPAAHLAISGRTMEFDGKGKCVAGC
jgi:hypothetical protein